MVKRCLPFVVNHKDDLSFLPVPLWLQTSQDLNYWKSKNNFNLECWGAFNFSVHVEMVVTLLCKVISPLCPDMFF